MCWRGIRTFRPGWWCRSLQSWAVAENALFQRQRSIYIVRVYIYIFLYTHTEYREGGIERERERVRRIILAERAVGELQCQGYGVQAFGRWACSWSCFLELFQVSGYFGYIFVPLTFGNSYMRSVWQGPMFISSNLRWYRMPEDSYVVPFWSWPVFLSGIVVYCPKKNYIGVSRWVYEDSRLGVHTKG